VDDETSLASGDEVDDDETLTSGEEVDEETSHVRRRGS
jgi:hypothetical protein